MISPRFTLRSVGREMAWFEFGPDQLSWGVGIWGQDRTVMNAFRLKLIHETERVISLFERMNRLKVTVNGDTAPRMKVPGEVPEALRPAYRLKSIYFEQTGIDYSLAFTDRLADRVARDCKAMKPAYLLLRECARSAAQEAPAAAQIADRYDF